MAAIQADLTNLVGYVTLLGGGGGRHIASVFSVQSRVVDGGIPVWAVPVLGLDYNSHSNSPGIAKRRRKETHVYPWKRRVAVRIPDIAESRGKRSDCCR